MQQSPVILHLCLRKTQSGNHVIIVTSSFTKSFVSKFFSVHMKTKSRRFQIPLVLRAFFEKLPFHNGLVWKAKLCFQISPA